MPMPHSETPGEYENARFSRSGRFDARPGVSRVELLAEFALGYRPDHGGNDPADDVRHALTAYITVAEWECVVDRIAAQGRRELDRELLHLSSIVSAQLEGCRQRRLAEEVDALGLDRGLLSEWVYEAIAEAYSKDSEIYDDEGYRRTEHLEAAARRKLVAKGYEANADHPAVELLVAEEIEQIFELSMQATYVGFQGGGNGEELAMARAHSELVRPVGTAAPTTKIRPTYRIRRQASARRSRGRGLRRRGSRRVSPRSTGPPGDDPDPEPSALSGIERTRLEMETTGFGLALGAAAGIGVKGPAIGALIGWLWGRSLLARQV
jgi:hypothetical protein